LPGGAGAIGKSITNILFNGGASAAANAPDWRVRISLADAANYFYNSPAKGILAPLFKGSTNQNGVIFPYTPQINVTHTARYSNQQLTHSNYNSYFYEGSEVQAINISGDFTVQNVAEGQYLLAAIYFFRSATKMWFGADKSAGNPPPMLYLDGYGAHYFPHVPCVITNFTHTMPAEVDYISIPPFQGGAPGLNASTFLNQVMGQIIPMGNPGAGNPTTDTRVPTTSNISITLQPIYSRAATGKFSLDSFARGELIKGKGGFI
jgi:hypothetical protein